MKNLLVLCFAMIAILACNKNCDEVTPGPCLEVKLEDFKASGSAKAIKTQTKDGSTYYWLNTDSRHLDGVEYVLNEACDTTCVYCGECFSTCEEQFEFEAWETIWEK